LWIKNGNNRSCREVRAWHTLTVTPEEVSVAGAAQSRVRRGSAAQIISRCRRLVVGFACAWLRAAKGTKKNYRKSTRDFQNHLTAHGFACAFAMVTATTPSAWLPH